LQLFSAVLTLFGNLAVNISDDGNNRAWHLHRCATIILH